MSPPKIESTHFFYSSVEDYIAPSGQRAKSKSCLSRHDKYGQGFVTAEEFFSRVCSLIIVCNTIGLERMLSS